MRLRKTLAVSKYTCAHIVQLRGCGQTIDHATICIAVYHSAKNEVQVDRLKSMKLNVAIVISTCRYTKLASELLDLCVHALECAMHLTMSV